MHDLDEIIAIDEVPETDIDVITTIKVGDNVFMGNKEFFITKSRNGNNGNNVTISAVSKIRGSISDNTILQVISLK